MRSALIQQPWAMLPERLQQLAGVVVGDEVGPVARQAPRDKEPAPAAQTTEDGVAVIALRGPMVRRASEFQKEIAALFGEAIAESDVLVELVAEAAGDDDIKAIVLDIHSPGGTVAGTEELAQAVAAAARAKPVVAQVTDMAASGAYWVASQANAIYATPNALVGSVGVYRAIVDRSKQAEQAGVEIKVVRSGDLKGTPVGEALSEQQLERQQAVVETMAARFFADVAARETISAEAMSEIKRGGIYAAEEAQRLGLIDGVQAFDATVAYSARKGATAMAASIKELKAAFKDDTEFVLECAEKELSLNEAKAAYAERLQAKLDAEKADHEKALAAAKAEAEEARAQAHEAEQKAQQAAAAGSGNQPVGGTAEDGNVGGDPVAEWNKLVEQATANCHTPLQRQQALGRVVARNPDLHKQYLAAQNGGQDHYSDFVAQSRRAAR